MTKTNLITGFLGSGKTTAIRHLLSHKPAEETWAVIVNEFGEVGIDGAFLANSGALVKEIPGGCICCVNGLPLQMGLNTLLKKKNIDRLLIEPTGLGHPKQIISLLTNPVYHTWIDLRATLCLLDGRNLGDPRIMQNENFRDQLACADVIVANKQDRIDPLEQQVLETWYLAHGLNRPLIAAVQGNVDQELLDLPHLNSAQIATPHQHTHSENKTHLMPGIDLRTNQRWRRHLNQGQGYFSCGWLFDKDTQFDADGVTDFVSQLDVERVKAVMRTPQGQLSLNCQGADVECQTSPLAPNDSRLEIIASEPLAWNTLQAQLLALRLG